MYYESHFGLSEPPFSISPDPRYLYLTQGHREALAHLLYGVSGSGGFVLLTGEIGSGKTTVCRCLLQQLPENVDVALVLNSKLGILEFLEAVCDELGVGIYGDKEVSLKLLTDKLYDYLLRSHGEARDTVLIIDEAQNLTPEVIEHLRLLTNLETDEKKLLQIILIGQPELRSLIASPALTQMAQRVTARFHLDLLSRADAKGYVEHRLKVAGCERQLFEDATVRYIWKKSGGVPRLMNAICDRALLGASIANRQLVNQKIAKKAVAEVLGIQASAKPVLRSPNSFKAALPALLALLIVVVGFYWFFSDRIQSQMKDPLSGLFQSDYGVEKPTKTAPGSLLESPSVNDSVNTSANAQVAQTVLTEVVDTGLSSTDPAVLERSVYTRLYQRWGLSYLSRDRQTDCEYLPTVGLHCLLGWTTLGTLVSLNRPVILSLQEEGGLTYPVLLDSIDDNEALVFSPKGERMVPIEELQRLWTGQYLILWRAPRAYNGVVRLGDRGEIVKWITDRLSPTENDSSGVFDETVVSRIRLIQQVYGLAPDGEAGPLTIIALNNFSGAPAPTLREASVADATAARE